MRDEGVLPFRKRSALRDLPVLLVPIGVMWLLHGVALLFGVRAVSGAWGIIPRSIHGFAGIAAAPFLHGNTEHLISNSIPLLILGALILLAGKTEFLTVTFITLLGAGLGTWLFGTPGSHHIGASGIVFGFAGFLLFRTVFDRRWSSALITLFVAAFYGTAIGFALLPEEGISWSGHLFGFAAGIYAARHIYRRKSLAAKAADDVLSSVGIRRIH